MTQPKRVRHVRLRYEDTLVAGGVLIQLKYRDRRVVVTIRAPDGVEIVHQKGPRDADNRTHQTRA